MVWLVDLPALGEASSRDWRLPSFPDYSRGLSVWESQEGIRLENLQQPGPPRLPLAS